MQPRPRPYETTMVFSPEPRVRVLISPRFRAVAVGVFALASGATRPADTAVAPNTTPYFKKSLRLFSFIGHLLCLWDFGIRCPTVEGGYFPDISLTRNL